LSGSGTTNKIAKWTGSTALGNSFYLLEDTNNITLSGVGGVYGDFGNNGGDLTFNAALNASDYYTGLEGYGGYFHFQNDTGALTFTNFTGGNDAGGILSAPITGFSSLQNGNFGIGLNNPSYTLDVAGSGHLSGAYYDASNASGTSGQVLSSTGTSTKWITSGGGGGSASGTAGAIQFSGGSGAFNADQNKLVFDNTNKRLGVGTTSPIAALTASSTGQVDALYVRGTTTLMSTTIHAGMSTCGSGGLFQLGLQGIEYCGTDNTDAGGAQLLVENTSSGTNAWGGVTINNNLGDSSLTHFFGMFLNSSNYNSTFFGNAIGVPNMAIIQNTDGPLSFFASTSTSPGYINWFTGGTATTNERMRLTNSGFLGLGTTTPNGYLTLHMDASSTANSALYTLGSSNPTLQLSQKPLTSPSANGTYLALNAPSSFSGSYLDFQKNGTSQMKFDTTNGLNIVNGLAVGANAYRNANSGSALSFSGNNLGAAAEFTFGTQSNNRAWTSGVGQTILLANNFSGIMAWNQTSGSGTFNEFEVQGPTITQTGTATGTVRGIYVNTYITTAADYRAFETSSTVVTLSTSSPVSGVTNFGYNVLLNPFTYTSASASQVTLTNASTLNVAPPSGTTASTTITSSTGITIKSVALTNVTNGYGLYVNAPTSATNNYAAAFIGGNVGIGTSSPSSALTVAGGSLLVQFPNTTLASFINTQAHGSAAGAGMIGGSDSGAAMSSGDRLGFLLFTGAKDNSHNLGNAAGVIGFASENWTSTSTGAELSFAVTPNSSTSRGEVARITNDGRLGIGSGTPTSVLSIKGIAGIPIFTVASSTNSPIFKITANGHTSWGGETPTVSSCGSSPSISGNDVTGRVLVGSGVVTSCTVTFARAYTNTPVCFAEAENSALAVAASSTPTSVVVTTASTIGSGSVIYKCEGISEP